MPAQINDQPVRLALDTGASDNMLIRRAADRLGLKMFDDLPVDIATTAGLKAEKEIILEKRGGAE